MLLQFQMRVQSKINFRQHSREPKLEVGIYQICALTFPLHEFDRLHNAMISDERGDYS